MTDPTRYPLAWPSHKPRTGWNARKRGHFTAGKSLITRVEAMARLERELAALGATYPLVSSDLVLRADGQPHLGKAEPRDPGVAVYFNLKGKPLCMACDGYDRLAQNMAAIANHIEATRRIERYGVATAAEVLQNFTALPPPAHSAPVAPPRTWWEVLGIPRDRAHPETVQAVWRTLCKTAAGRGDEPALLELNLARDAALKELGARVA